MFNSSLQLSLCRTCLVSLSQTNVYNIFSTLDLANKLKLCSGLPVEITDVYPENICQHCYEQILLFYEFQQMCSKSLDTFNGWLETKETLVEEIENKNCQITNETEDPLNRDLNEVTCIRKTLIEPTDKIEDLNKRMEKKKMGRPPRIKLENKQLERKTGIKRSSSNVKQIVVDISTSKDEMMEDLEEYLLFDNEDEKESLNKDTLNDKVFNNFNTEVSTTPDSPTFSENSSSHKLTSQPQNHHCVRCSQTFSTLHRLQVHIRQHDGFPPYTCTLKGCGRSFNRWHFYNKHQNEHNLKEEKSFKCDLANCERVYKNKSALNIHKRKFHKFGPELKTHMCEICGKIFKSSAVLNNHHYIHIDKTKLPFACEEKDCVKRFSTKEKLRIHKLRHSGIKNFTCPYCGMRKTTRHELKIHINYHTLEKTWPCRFCPKVCNSAGNLKMHIRNMHEGAKDFACRFCERKFAKADTKKYHEMIHTGEKPHECKDCGRRFVQPAALRTHRKIHLRQKENLGKAQKRKINISIELLPNATEENLS